MNEPILALAKAIEAQEPAVLATVVAVQGASPAKVGAQLAYWDDGLMAGTVGGGNLEAAILADIRATLQSREARLATYSLTTEGRDAVNALCGGEIRVFLQPYFPPPQLVIVGGGHIGRPLQNLAAELGFEVRVVDVEPGRADAGQVAELSLREDSYIVLITTDYISDEAALRQALASPAGYIGMIGSRAKCRTVIDKLQTDSFSEEELARVYAPIGLDLGGPTPAEIALAILAEKVAVRRGKLTDTQHQICARRGPLTRHSTAA
jgi:xanthine dehydrogenase accessory factor